MWGRPKNRLLEEIILVLGGCVRVRVVWVSDE